MLSARHLPTGVSLAPPQSDSNTVTPTPPPPQQPPSSGYTPPEVTEEQLDEMDAYLAEKERKKQRNRQILAAAQASSEWHDVVTENEEISGQNESRITAKKQARKPRADGICDPAFGASKKGGPLRPPERLNKASPDFLSSNLKASLQVAKKPNQNAAGSPNQNPEHFEVQWLPMTSVRPAPENNEIYNGFNPKNRSDQRFLHNVKKNGVRVPIEVSADGYILSGHRRWSAARRLRHTKIKCHVNPDVRHGTEEFRRLLIEFNAQRHKSRFDMLREGIVLTDPAQAFKRQQIERATAEKQAERAADIAIDKIEAGQYKRRSQIVTGMELINAVIAILPSLQKRPSLRRIHYLLLNNPPLRNSRKRDSVYKADDDSYQALIRRMSVAREHGLIAWGQIYDPTRPVFVWKTFEAVGLFITEHLKAMFAGYRRDLLQSQPNWIEVFCEKNTLTEVISPICNDFTLPLTIGVGCCSGEPRAQLAQRFLTSGRPYLVLLILSDHDPAGAVIAQNFARSMQMFGINESRVRAFKVAITPEQIRNPGFKLHSGGQAKRGSATYEKFVAQYGPDIYELESMAEGDLQAELRQKIRAVLDLEAFNHELDEQQKDLAFLETARDQLLKAWRSIQKPLMRQLKRSAASKTTESSSPSCARQRSSHDPAKSLTTKNIESNP
jgi:hypothetical protein